MIDPNRYSVSTVAYSGHSLEQALDSLHRLGVQNIELALILGAVHGLTESDLTEANALNIRAMLDQRQMHCTSLAAHCHMTLADCNALLKKRVRLAHLLGCPRLILYAPRECSLAQFQQAASGALTEALNCQVRILLENVGDRQPYMLNDATDIAAVLAELDLRVLGVNFDPGNLASHRPDLDLLEHSLLSTRLAEHIHIKDLRPCGQHFEFCAIGAGIGRYPEMFRQARCYMPFFSIEAPFSLIRHQDGQAELKPVADIPSLGEIEQRLSASLQAIAAAETDLE